MADGLFSTSGLLRRGLFAPQPEQPQLAGAPSINAPGPVRPGQLADVPQPQIAQPSIQAPGMPIVRQPGGPLERVIGGGAAEGGEQEPSRGGVVADSRMDELRAQYLDPGLAEDDARDRFRLGLSQAVIDSVPGSSALALINRAISAGIMSDMQGREAERKKVDELIRTDIMNRFTTAKNDPDALRQIMTDASAVSPEFAESLGSILKTESDRLKTNAQIKADEAAELQSRATAARQTAEAENIPLQLDLDSRIADSEAAARTMNADSNRLNAVANMTNASVNRDRLSAEQQALASGLDPDRAKASGDIRADFMREPSFEQAESVAAAVRNVQTTAQEVLAGNQQAATSLIYAAARADDPEARQLSDQDIRIRAEAGSLSRVIQSKWDKAVAGTLPESSVRELVSLSNAKGKAARTALNSTAESYRVVAGQAGADPAFVTQTTLDQLDLTVPKTPAELIREAMERRRGGGQQ